MTLSGRLRRRPIVMLSSTIGELDKLRSVVTGAVDRLGVADAWLFEMHAVAAGAPPEAQYLEMARTCDLFVLVVGSAQSDATEAEYVSARDDNPEKVLAFFVGPDAGDTQQFRAQLSTRHTYVRRGRAIDLATPIVEAISHWVTDGRVVRAALIAALDIRLAASEGASQAAALSFVPRVLPETDRDSVLAVTRAFETATRTALSGVGGAGKTIAALVALRHKAKVEGSIALHLRARPGATGIEELILAELDAVRFSCSESLIWEWARRGRIFVCLDGLEGVMSTDRRAILESFDSFAGRFPRSIYLVCARRFAAEQLTQFRRYEVAALDGQQRGDFLSAIGASGPTPRVPDQLEDLAHWPFWLRALVEVGPSAETGLLLLQGLITTRLRAVAMPEGIERAQIRAAAGVLAYEIWPRTSAPIAEALKILDSDVTRTALSRFDLPPAARVLELLDRGGLVSLADGVEFGHAMLTTILAAEHAVGLDDIPSAVTADPDLSPFVAALLKDDRQNLLLEIASNQGVVGIARLLRLIPSCQREVDIAQDVDRFVIGLQALGVQDPLTVLVSETWVAWGPAVGDYKLRFSATAKDFEDLVRNGAEREVLLASGMPFANHFPEFWSLIEALSRWKTRFVQLDPGGQLAHLRRLSEKEVRDMIGRGESLEERIIQALLDRRQAYRALIAQAGVEDVTELAAYRGDPSSTIYAGGSEVRILTEWGTGNASVTVENTDGGWRGSSLGSLLVEDPRAEVFRELKDRVERLIGCSLESQAWRRPELVASWAW